MNKKVYFARCIEQYGKEEDSEDIINFMKLGFGIIDPKEFFDKETYDDIGMQHFYNHIKKADVFAFRSLPTGNITAGVSKEIHYAHNINIPVLELNQNNMQRRRMRTLSVEETREYLKQKGVR